MKQNEKDIVDKSQIVYKTLNEVLHESMIPYTEHVVMDRALPRVEDGLKPVQRRILYSMLELGLTPDKQYRKSARIVGDCMGKYHPHGDSSVYDAMVRMAQDYSLREPLVDGHGNFGSIDGDSAAAMRYTEAKMTPLALEILRDLDKNTVDWCLNFDDTLKEPIVLPGRFPNLLVNGATGIAVGVATNIPPHNLGEVIDGVCAYIKNPKISLSQMMKHIKAPDFPTGGLIIAGEGLKEAYETGKGKITIKAKIHTEKDGEKSAIVITELPYQTNKATLLQKIAELKEKEKGGVLSYIGEITDESDRNGMRAVIKVKKGGNSKAILNYILKNTNLEQSFNINMVAIAGGKPKLMGLIEIISYYVNYQISIIVRRTKFDLDNALAREHIVKGLLVAIKNIDEIIKIIKGSQSVSEAKQKIMQRFALTDIQAQAILDMRIARLVNLEVKKLEEEFAQLQISIKNLSAILASKQVQEDLIISELKDIKKRYENKRKSEIVLEKPQEQEEIFDLVDCDFSELNYITLSADHRMKRMVIKNTVSSNGSEPNNLYEINEDCIKANDNESIFVITNKGNCIKTRVKDFPLLQWKSKGALLSEINKTILFDEFAVRILPILKEEAVVTLYTKKGMAKQIPIRELKINRAIFSIMNLKENDEIINAEYENENSNIIAITKMSYSLKFAKSELPMQKRASVGVKILKMQDDDEVVFAGLVQKIGSMIIIANNGYGKKVPIGDYEIMSKYRRGLKTISLKNDNSESVIFAKFSLKSFDLALENKGKFKIFNTDKLRYETRISKGNKIDKTNFNNIYLMLDKGKLD